MTTLTFLLTCYGHLMMLQPTDNGVGPESTARVLGVAVNTDIADKRFAGLLSAQSVLERVA